jgi:hypothetical protein
MIVIDDYLPKDNIKYLSDYFNQNVTFVDNNQDPQNQVEDFLKHTWNNFGMLEGCVGFEYWSGCFGDDCPTYPEKDYNGNKWHKDAMAFHQDYDLVHYKETKEKLFPKMGLVYFLHETPVQGGYLVIKREDGYMEWIQPKSNRLVIFESNLEHGVDKIYSGTRKTIVSNLWEQKPKEEVL